MFFNAIFLLIFFVSFYQLLRGLLTSLIMKVDLPISLFLPSFGALYILKWCYYVHPHLWYVFLLNNPFAILLYFSKSVFWYINIGIPALVVSKCIHSFSASLVSPLYFLFCRNLLKPLVYWLCILILLFHGYRSFFFIYWHYYFKGYVRVWLLFTF